MENTDLAQSINEVFTTESIIIIDSTKRNVVSYPNANYFSIQLPKIMAKMKEVILTHLVTQTGAIPTPQIFIQISPMNGTNILYPNGNGQVTFMVATNGTPVYTSMNRENDVCVFPAQSAPNISTMTISVVDNNGNLIAMNDYIMRLYVRSKY